MQCLDALEHTNTTPSSLPLLELFHLLLMNLLRNFVIELLSLEAVTSNRVVISTFQEEPTHDVSYWYIRWVIQYPEL